MRRRFWRAVFRYAAPRTGWERYARDRDALMDAHLATMSAESLEWAEASLPIAMETWPLYGPTTTTATVGTGNVIWKSS